MLCGMCGLGFSIHNSHFRVAAALRWRISLRKGCANLNKDILQVESLECILQRYDQAVVEQQGQISSMRLAKSIRLELTCRISRLASIGRIFHDLQVIKGQIADPVERR